MKIYYVATSPPRQCGIATFTSNLLQASGSYPDPTSPVSWSAVAAIEEEPVERDYPNEVRHIIHNNDPHAYRKAAHSINAAGADVCVLQHEYGLFAGDDGVHVLQLVDTLRIPLIVTLHTVLERPSFQQRVIIQRLAQAAHALVVMSHRAVRFLVDIYGVPHEKIRRIEHGVPNVPSGPREELRRRLGWQDRRVLMTFGLLGRNKGIETVLHALPAVVELHPDLLYLVLGNTHPNVVRQEGESYRESLLDLVRELGLENNVRFQPGFLAEEELFDYLTATDLYVTPYLSRAQITSGTLAYAVGAGAAVLSTPYWHAEELLAEDRGILFDFRDSKVLARHLLDLLDHPERLAYYRKKAAGYAQKIRWTAVGREYFKLYSQAQQEYLAHHYQGKGPQQIDGTLLPRIELDHFKRLTDDTGIVQHARYGVPFLKEGYCIDDNSRALIAALMAYRQLKDREVLELLPIYLSFISYMQTLRGSFRNFLTFSRQYIDAEGSEDAFGRTLWALGYLVAHAPNEAYLELGAELFRKALPNTHALISPRGAANSIIGMYYFLQRYPGEPEVREAMRHLSTRLVENYDRTAGPDWTWFEDILTYDNGLLPLSLWLAGDALGDKRLLEIAQATTDFLESNILRNGVLSVVGNQGWFPRGGECSRRGEQPIDAMAAVLLFQGAYRVTRNIRYLQKMYQGFLWFTGRNSPGLSLYDPETKGCCDGLEPNYVNRNQGAESTTAYLIARLAVQEMLPELQKRKASRQGETMREQEMARMEG